MYPHKFIPGLFKNILIFTIIIQFISCHCSDINCPGLDAKYVEYLSSHKGDNIQFVNSVGNTISFYISDSDSTGAETIECGPDGLGGCKCPDCGPTTASFRGTTTDNSWQLIDSSGNVAHTFNYLAGSISYEPVPLNNDGRHLSYTILDHYYAVIIDPGFTVYGNDSIVSNLTVGTKIYDSVFIHHTDTTQPPAHTYPHTANTYFVITSYYTKKYGVVGFYDMRTQSLFYRP